MANSHSWVVQLQVHFHLLLFISVPQGLNFPYFFFKRAISTKTGTKFSLLMDEIHVEPLFMATLFAQILVESF